MNLPNCFICNRPVLELQGQFEKFDSYLLNEDDNALEQDAYGWCHSSCLSTSEWGAYWHKKYLAFQEGLALKNIQEFNNTYILLKRRNEFLLLNKNGLSYSFKTSDFKTRKITKNGILIPVSHELNLEFKDRLDVMKIRDTLLEQKTFPLINVVEMFGLKDRLIFPQAIEEGQLHFDEELKEEWRANWVSCQVKYHQYISLENPKELEKFILSIDEESPTNIRQVYSSTPKLVVEKKTIHKAPWKYTLFEQGDDIILEVVCGGAAIYTVEVTLDEVQKEKYQKEGLSYIAALAEKITKNPKAYQSDKASPT